MTQPKPLTGAQAKAAVLTAEDELSDEAIAAAVGVTRKTLFRWRELPMFQEAVATHVSEIERHARRLSIARVEKRLAVLDDLKGKYLQVIAERAEDYAKDPEAAPGAKTGLMARQERVIGSGDMAMHVIEWKADTAITDAIQNLDAQAAKELGQWTEKVDVSGNFLDALRAFGRGNART